jgi:hypothetical protein
MFGRCKAVTSQPDDIQVELETDCASVAAKVLSNSRDSSVTSAIIGDIKEIIRQRGPCRI